MDLEKLKYPIGKYEVPEQFSTTLTNQWIIEIETFPEALKILTADLGDAELNWKYRPEGWTIKQVVHHCADSHMNSIIRFKLALTEEVPTIRPYREDRWAELPDATTNDISASVLLLTGLHNKWGILLRNLTDTQLKCQFIHPEQGQRYTIEETIGFYAWHSNHHLAHIKQAVNSGGIYN